MQVQDFSPKPERKYRLGDET